MRVTEVWCHAFVNPGSSPSGMLNSGTQVSFSPILSAFSLFPWKLRSHTHCSSGTVFETPWPCVLAQSEAGILGREQFVAVRSKKEQPVTSVSISSKERMCISGKIQQHHYEGRALVQTMGSVPFQPKGTPQGSLETLVVLN